MVVLLTTGREARVYDRMLRGHHFDGMIMLSTDVDDPILPVLIKDGGPLVLIGRHPYFQDVTYVDFENREWAREAAKTGERPRDILAADIASRDADPRDEDGTAGDE